MTLYTICQFASILEIRELKSGWFWCRPTRVVYFVISCIQSVFSFFLLWESIAIELNNIELNIEFCNNIAAYGYSVIMVGTLILLVCMTGSRPPRTCNISKNMYVVLLANYAANSIRFFLKC